MRVVNEDVLRLISNTLFKEKDINSLVIEFDYTLDCKSPEPKFKELFHLPSEKIIDEIIFIITTYKYELGQSDITKNLNVCIKYNALCKLNNSDKYSNKPFFILLTI